MQLNNKYYILRHGEALSNVKGIISSWPEKINNPLTENGVAQIEKVAQKLKNTYAEQGQSINLIFSSDLLRTEQTAEIIKKEIGIKIEFDERLREIDFGAFSSGPTAEFEKYFKNNLERIERAVPNGESYNDVFKRMADFFEEINKKYKDENILIVSHQAPLFLLEGYIKGFSVLETIEFFSEEGQMLYNGELRELIQ